MKDALKAAIDSLEIQDVYISKLDSSLDDNFDPKYSPERNALVVQYRHIVERGEFVELKNDENPDDVQKIFKVFISFGARWVCEKTPEQQEGEEEVKAKVEAVYVLEYKIIKEIDQKSLDVFALNNASYHAWPYWRELLMSHCLRMNMPKLVLPAMQLASNRKSLEHS